METITIIIQSEPQTSLLQNLARWVMGANLIFAGFSHLFWAREEFQSQVPPWLPLDADFVVLASGVVEIILGALLLQAKYKAAIGWMVAFFFVAIFPGNISQYVNQVDGFGLNTDEARFIRLFFQPIFVTVALWSTGAWSAWRNS